MKIYAVRFAAFLIGSLSLSHSVAEEYDYDIGVSYGNSNTDLESPVAVLGGDPATTFGTNARSTDSDPLKVSGTWYYSGLSDDKGPRSRAAFLSRASSASLAYSYIDEAASFSSTGLTSPPAPQGLPTIQPSSGRTEGTTRELKADLRHIWQSSGWYGLAGAARFDSKLDTVTSTGPDFSSDLDGSTYYAGIGKYLGDATAVDFKVTRSEVEGLDSTGYALSLSHIGSLGSKWQYAADLEYSMFDSDLNNTDGSYLARLSLFPTANFEFGVRLMREENEFSPDLDSYEGFAGWFVRDDIELRAWYNDSDFDGSSFTDINSNQFGVGVNVRF